MSARCTAALFVALVVSTGCLVAPCASLAKGPSTDRDPGPRFTLYATERIEAGTGLVVKSGDIAVSGGPAATGSNEVPAVVLRGANVSGDIYGPSVSLGTGSAARAVYTDAFHAGRGVEFEAVHAFPRDLPALAAAPRLAPTSVGLVVPSHSTGVLSPLLADVVVEKGATLVLEGGSYQVESLELRNESRIEVLAPSTVVVTRSLVLGPRAWVGNPRQPRDVFLDLIVSGADSAGGPAARIGDRARVRAALRVPHGSLAVGSGVVARGGFYARYVAVADDLHIQYSAWTRSPIQSPQCYRHECSILDDGRLDCVRFPTEGAACEDGDACTEPDSCDGDGHCIAGPSVPAPDPLGEDACLRDVCDPVLGVYEPLGSVCETEVECRDATLCNGAGQCSLADTPHPEGAFCDDAVANNGPDVCTSAGACVGLGTATSCTTNLCGDPADLECWLNDRTDIRGALTWFSISGGAPNYSSWSPAQKQELQQAYEDARTWLASGLANFPGNVPPHPLPNALVLADADGAATGLEESVAWPLYLASVGHILAMELGSHVPWSLCELDILQLVELLSSFDSNFTNSGNGFYTPVGRAVTPAHPTIKYQFMVDSGLIGATRLETISLLLDWARRLDHNLYGLSTENAEHHWQYRGYGPVDRMIEGTINTLPGFGPVFGNWTRGCTGTQAFLKEILLTVNIPVALTTVPCGHAQPSFPTEGFHLSHADDLYSFYQEGTTNTLPPLGAMLVDAATFSSWFSGPPTEACANVGRRPVELAVQYIPDWVAEQYCWDVSLNNSHAGGYVYQNYDHRFTVAELEAMGFWDDLSQAALDLGLPCGGM